MNADCESVYPARHLGSTVWKDLPVSGGVIHVRGGKLQKRCGTFHELFRNRNTHHRAGDYEVREVVTCKDMFQSGSGDEQGVHAVPLIGIDRIPRKDYLCIGQRKKLRAQPPSTVSEG